MTSSPRPLLSMLLIGTKRDTAQSGKFSPPGDLSVGDLFVVKLCTDGSVFDETRSVACSNLQAREFVAGREANIQKALDKHGYEGLKAYFNARVTEEGTLEVFLDDPQPLQPW